MKVGLILLSGPAKPIPSTRVAILNVLPLLEKMGISCHILFAPPVPTETPSLPEDLLATIVSGKFDAVIFQKVHGPSVAALATELRDLGIPTAYVVCDIVKPEMARLTNATVVVTDFLRSQYPPDLRHKVHVVHDGIERPQVCKWPSPMPGSSKVLNAVLVTSTPLDHLPVLGLPPSWLNVTVVAAYPPAEQWRQRAAQIYWLLRKASSHAQRLRSLAYFAHPRIRCVPWGPDSVYDHLVAADVGIIPVETDGWAPCDDGPPPLWAMKSENRLTLKMAVGLPVVATPIPSYLPVVGAMGAALLARNRSEWIARLHELRSPALRQRVGELARAAVVTRYSVERQASLLSGVLRSIQSAPSSLDHRPDTSCSEGS